MERKLTTEQIELLILLNEIAEYVEKEKYELTTPIDEIIVSNGMKDAEDFYEITDLLDVYGYIDEDYIPTQEGKQYVKLLKEYAEEQKNQPKAIVNKKYALINIDELSVSAIGSLLEMDNSIVSNMKMVLGKFITK